MVHVEMEAVRERAEYVPHMMIEAERRAAIALNNPNYVSRLQYGPEHVARKIAEAEATLAALHLAVGGLECYRIEVPDYDDEFSATLLAGYCFKGDGYLLGFYDRAILIS